MQEDMLYHYNDYEWVNIGGMAVADHGGRPYDRMLYRPTIDAGSGGEVQVTFEAEEGERIRQKTFRLTMGSRVLEAQYEVDFDNRWENLTTGTPIALIAAAAIAENGTNEYYYCVENGSTNFYRYDFSRDLWESCSPLPTASAPGVSLVRADNGGRVYIYATPGGGSTSLYRYDVVSDSWQSMSSLPPPPVGFDSGTAGIWTRDNYLWFIQGGTNNLRRYNVATDAWEVVFSAPVTFGEGASLAWSGENFLYTFEGGGSNSFYRYSISEDSWSQLANTPAPVGAGAGLVAFSYDPTGGTIAGAERVRYLYAAAGGGSDSFWRYSVQSDAWESLESLPAELGLPEGNRLALRGHYVYVASGREDQQFWRYFVWTSTLYMKHALTPDLHDLILEGQRYLREEQTGGHYQLWNTHTRTAVGIKYGDTGYSSQFTGTLYRMLEIYFNGVGRESFRYGLLTA
jgi:hypothetical protein